MNRLNIGEKILNLRKEKNITQEQLAFMVGVSAGAVSKWENGNSMPDISLLAPLARALNTSLDNLLSFHKELSNAEVDNIKKELTEIFLHEGYAIGEAKCQKYLKEYPNSIYLKLIAAGLIEMYLMMSENPSDEFIKDKKQYSLDLFKQVSESKEPKYAPIALFSIASIQMSLENYDESEKALKELPRMQIDSCTLYPTLYLKQGKTKEAMQFCSSSLLQYVNNTFYTLITLSSISIAEQNYESALFYLDSAYKIQNMFKIGLGSASYNYCRLYIKANQKDFAAKWFKTYIEELLSYEYDYHNNHYFKDIKLQINPDNQKIIRKKLLNSLIDEDKFKTLSGIPEYESSIEKLKLAVNKM